MFTGIIETTGKIIAIQKQETNLEFTIQSPISHQLKPDQSVSHNGICLTVTEVQNDTHKVTAIAETISKTAIANWQQNSIINLERCMQINDRLDGHIVQGHVDATATCTKVQSQQGSWLYSFSYPAQYMHLVIEKGSICLNGIALTVFNLHQNNFTVAIIPYTYEHTDMHTLQAGQAVNIEFDVVGKYLARFVQTNYK
jgi:riboflavin synthase